MQSKQMTTAPLVSAVPDIPKNNTQRPYADRILHLLGQVGVLLQVTQQLDKDPGSLHSYEDLLALQDRLYMAIDETVSI